jgi:hypothetical protein
VTAYDGAVLGVVLTGMGSDGRNGAGEIRAAGGTVVVQDQATSVVWGMPGAIAQAGLADEILPLDRIPEAITRHLAGSPTARWLPPPCPEAPMTLTRTSFDWVRALCAQGERDRAPAGQGVPRRGAAARRSPASAGSPMSRRSWRPCGAVPTRQHAQHRRGLTTNETSWFRTVIPSPR